MRGRLVSHLAWVGLVASLLLMGSFSFGPARAGELANAEVTPTPTPTLAAPVLLEPADAAVLPQPIPPQFWTFRWSALGSPCKCSIAVWLPDGSIYLSEHNIAPPREYAYYYATASPLPRGPWYWKVWVTCPYGSSESETRTFSIEPTPTPAGQTHTHLPVLWNMAP